MDFDRICMEKNNDIKYRKFRVGQRVYIAQMDVKYTVEEDSIKKVCIELFEKETITSWIEINKTSRRFYSDCNHGDFIFTNKKEAKKAVQKLNRLVYGL